MKDDVFCVSLSLSLPLRARTSLHLFLRLRLDGKDLVKTRNAPAHAHKPITRKLVFLFRLKVCGGPYFLSLRLIHAHKKKKYLIAKKMGRRGGEGGRGGRGGGGCSLLLRKTCLPLLNRTQCWNNNTGNKCLKESKKNQKLSGVIETSNIFYYQNNSKKKKRLSLSPLGALGIFKNTFFFFFGRLFVCFVCLSHSDLPTHRIYPLPPTLLGVVEKLKFWVSRVHWGGFLMF